MKIGIDCRMYGLKHGGVGRYIENLVEELFKINDNNQYILFVRKDFPDSQKFLSSNFKIVSSDFPHYSLKEQVFFPSIINNENLDIMHFPHFNVPVFYFGKYLVTIHDLIKHTSKGMQTTTKNAWLYWLKYLGYKLVFASAVKRAKKIITPSKFVKGEIIKEYQVDPQKIEVTYEGVDQRITNYELRIKNKDKIFEKYNIKKPFLLYVGSVYPHKNVLNLIKAVAFLNQENHSSFPKITLVIICGRSVFWQRLQNKIKEMEVEDLVKMTGFVPDEELGSFYQEALAFTFPSLSEGFGLPGLEAMANNLPLVCSDIPVFHEIYGNAAEYFNPFNPEDMAKKIKEVIMDEKMKSNLVKKGLERVKDFSWQKMASQTLQIYNSVL